MSSSITRNFNLPSATMYSPGSSLSQPFVPGPGTTSTTTATSPGAGSTPTSVQLGATSAPISQTTGGQYGVNTTVSGPNGQSIHIQVDGSDPAAVARGAQLAYRNGLGVQAGSGNALLPNFGSQEPQGRPMPGVSDISVAVSDSAGHSTGVLETLNAQGAATHATTSNVSTDDSRGLYIGTSTDTVLNGDATNDASVTAGGATVRGTDINAVENAALDNATGNDNASGSPTVQSASPGIVGVLTYSGSGQGTGSGRTASTSATYAAVTNGNVQSYGTTTVNSGGSTALSDSAASAQQQELANARNLVLASPTGTPSSVSPAVSQAVITNINGGSPPASPQSPLSSVGDDTQLTQVPLQTSTSTLDPQAQQAVQNFINKFGQ